ncbi:MAG TPA: hypothetical protein VN974_08045 [Candidatus Dormibacteraeota bacterium]|nr:hypothetical protein [Candidatus Dormibacteraeota bacterium]
MRTSPDVHCGENGETIILDSGTTTVEIARYLKIIKTQSITV